MTQEVTTKGIHSSKKIWKCMGASQSLLFIGVPATLSVRPVLESSKNGMPVPAGFDRQVLVELNKPMKTPRDHTTQLKERQASSLIIQRQIGVAWHHSECSRNQNESFGWGFWKVGSLLGIALLPEECSVTCCGELSAAKLQCWQDV